MLLTRRIRKTVTKRLPIPLLALGVLALASCTPGGSGPETRVISVSPYSSLGDRELNGHYVLVLDELQALKDEMEQAIEKEDRAVAHARASRILEKAREARKIAGYFDDPVIREKRLRAADELIPDLEHLVEITR